MKVTCEHKSAMTFIGFSIPIRCQDLSGAAMDALLRQPGDIHFVDSYTCVVRTEDRAR